MEMEMIFGQWIAIFSISLAEPKKTSVLSIKFYNEFKLQISHKIFGNLLVSLVNKLEITRHAIKTAVLSPLALMIRVLPYPIKSLTEFGQG